MGWDYTAYYNRLSHKERREELDKEFTWGNSTRTNRVIKSTIKSNTYYAAVETLDVETSTREVFGLVCLLGQYTENGVIWYGVKSMSEDMGPYCFDCPSSILNLLTPTDNTYANEWRRKCRENIARPSLSSLPEGAVIRFASPWDTRSGIKQGDIVTLTKAVKSRVFSARTGRTRTSYIWTCGWYRWSTKMIPKDFEVVSA